MGKAIHTLSNFNNDVKIANKRGNIVFLNDGLGDALDRYGRVFIAVEGCAKKYVLRSVVMNRAPGVEIVMLRRNLTVTRSAVLVLRSPR